MAWCRRSRIGWTVVMLVQAFAGASTAAAAAHGPRVPDEVDQIRRELRIGAGVFQAALADAIPEDRRVLNVEAGYLAGQGVLVIAEVAAPWFRGHDIDINPDITSLEQIPDMVQDILSEMNLGLTPDQAENLKELREIRDAQRQVRGQQRELRAELRETRRALLRTDDPTRGDALRQEIDALNQELAALEEEERALETDVTAVRDSIGETSRAAGDPGAPAGLDLAVAEAACGYGATFRSLSADQHLNVLVQQPRASRYYVFRMGDVRRCQAGELDAEALLEGSYAYGN